MVGSIAQAFAGTVVQVSPGENLLNNASSAAQSAPDSTVASVWSTLGDATSITSIAAITTGALAVGIMVVVFVFRAFGYGGSSAPTVSVPVSAPKLV
jgi:hypothetical protein